jgi:hypothetical protein
MPASAIRSAIASKESAARRRLIASVTRRPKYAAQEAHLACRLGGRIGQFDLDLGHVPIIPKTRAGRRWSRWGWGEQRRPGYAAPPLREGSRGATPL